MSKKDRERICILCDSKCERYHEGKLTSFTPLKSHKLQNAEQVYFDCRFYTYKED